MNLKNALIVDDSRLAQFVLKKMLLAHDMSVDTSESAEEALKYLESKNPDIIFLDHTMPGMNGLEMLKVIKDNPETAVIPIMMYTSQEDSSYMSKARELGAIDVLPKQLKSSELEQALNRLSDIDQAQAEAITSTANATLTQEKEELKQLVMDAEAALNRETMEQKLRQRIDKVSKKSEQAITSIHSKIDTLIPSVEHSRNKQTFWNNILWGAIYVLTVTVFVAFYIKQQNKIDSLQTAQATPPAVRTAPQNAPRPKPEIPIASIQTPDDNTSLDANRDSADLTSTQARLNQEDLKQEGINALEQIFNNQSKIPFNELLLSDTVQTNLNELIASLKALDFSGQVNLLAHDGNFCVSTNEAGQFDLATDDTAVTQCQITEASERLADIASIDLLQLITANNKSPDTDFLITITPLSTNQPLEDYPPQTHETVAAQWNTVALKNRRVEVQLVSR